MWEITLPVLLIPVVILSLDTAIEGREQLCDVVVTTGVSTNTSSESVDKKKQKINLLFVVCVSFFIQYCDVIVNTGMCVCVYGVAGKR